MYVLSLLPLIQPYLNNNTPRVVIEELQLTHGLTYDQISQSYIGYPVRTIDHPIKSDDYRYLARFLNPQTNWTRKTLEMAITHIQRLKSLQLTDLPGNFESGLPTPQAPTKVNLTLLYAYCCHHHLTTTPITSEDDLVRGVRSLLYPPTYLLSQILISGQLFDSESTRSVRELALRYPFDLLPPEEINHTNLEGLHRRLKRVTDERILSYFEPIEGIALGAIVFDRDLSQAEDPIALLRCIYFNQDSADNYKLLSKNFNPVFPSCYYSINALRCLLEEDSDNFFESKEEIYDYLVVKYHCNTFFIGSRDKILNHESPYDYEILTEIPNDQIIVYGNPIDGFTFFTVDELIGLFRAHRQFRDPIETQHLLTDSQIRRLRYLARTHHLEQFQDVINEIDAYTQIDQELTHLFVESYHKINQDDQSKIRDFFRLFFQLGLYTRGWKGEDHPYPIEEIPEYDPDEVEITTQLHLIQVVNSLEQLEMNLRQIIEELPLVKYQDGFITNHDSRIGRNIKEKIIIIGQGLRHNDVLGSCIRASSGWIICTAYCYQRMIGLTPDFRIEAIRYVL